MSCDVCSANRGVAAGDTFAQLLEHDKLRMMQQHCYDALIHGCFRRAKDIKLGSAVDCKDTFEPSGVLPHREARSEAEALRQRLTSAEAHAESLQRENQGLRARIGEAEEPTSLGSTALQLPTGPLLLPTGSGGQCAESRQAEPAGGPVEPQEGPGQLSAAELPPLQAKNSDVGAAHAGGPPASAQDDASRTPIAGPEDIAVGGAGKDVKED